MSRLFLDNVRFGDGVFVTLMKPGARHLFRGLEFLFWLFGNGTGNQGIGLGTVLAP